MATESRKGAYQRRNERDQAGADERWSRLSDEERAFFLDVAAARVFPWKIKPAWIEAVAKGIAYGIWEQSLQPIGALET